MLGTLGDPISNAAYNTVIDKLKICEKLNNNSRHTKNWIIVECGHKAVWDQLPKDGYSVRSYTMKFKASGHRREN